MFGRNRTQQNQSMQGQSSNRMNPYQGSSRSSQNQGFNRSNHDTTSSQQYGQDQQAQRQNFSGGFQASQNAPYQPYYNDETTRTASSQQWQQHEVPPNTSFGGSSTYSEGNSSYGQEGQQDRYGSENSRMSPQYDRQGYHPSKSMNEGVYRPDSYSSSGMPQSSEQIGSRYYSEQSNPQYSGQRSSYGNFGAQNYGSSSYGSDSSSRMSQGSQGSTQGVWGAPNTASLYGEHSGKGPKSYRRSEERIREDVCETLAHHGGIDASEIDVQVADGLVTLTGTIESRQMKRMAEEAIEHLSGVKDIKNELKVEEPSSSSYAKHSAFSDTSSMEGSRSAGSSSMGSKSPSATSGRSSSSSSSTTKQ